MSFPRYPKYKHSGVEWLGEVPEGWDVLAIKRLSKVRRGASPRPIDDVKYFDEEGEYAWVRIEDVSAGNGVLHSTTQRLSTLGSSLSVKIEPGSLFMSIAGTVGKPCIAGIRACIHDGFVYFPELSIDPRFLFKIFEAGLCYGGLGKLGTQLNLNTETIGSIRIALPPHNELDRLLDWLDEETGRIDQLIAEQQRLIELLKEKRQAVISHAVTKGMNPNATMKDSNIQWLGPVPAHWKLKPLKFLIERDGLIRGPFGGDLKKEIFQESGIKVYEQKNAIYRDVHLGVSYISESKFADMARFRASEGDYIMSCSGTVGKAYRLPEGAPTGIINQALLIIRFSERLCYQFTDWVFDSSFFTEQILDNSQGGAMKNLVGLDVFRSITLPVPPLAEQLSIGSYLSAETARLDALTDEATHAIDLLQERRIALISAAVTGKIDVRNAVPECVG